MQGAGVGFRNRSVSASHFTMVPRSDVPRSVFQMDFTHKTAFDAGKVVPVYLEEVLPGDHFQVNMTAFARMATPLFPIMDNFHLDSFFFFVPNRLVWDNWVKMMGERKDPDDTIDFTTPQQVFTAPPEVGSIFDYMGIPTAGQVTENTLSVNALPIRAYWLVWNEWFRDQNLGNPVPVDTDDGPDAWDAGSAGDLAPRFKRHDYFTSALPWPQKGDAVSISLTGDAPVYGIGLQSTTADAGPVLTYQTGGNTVQYNGYTGSSAGVGRDIRIDQDTNGNPEIYADMSEVTAATINALRQAFQVQRLLERDARGGTRYTELLLSHFGVQPQDARLQRPEYLGGGTINLSISPIAQTSATGLTGGSSPLGALGGIGTGLARHGFSSSFAEHGFILGLVSVRADLTYQQGLHRMWSRETRYDYYWPAFAHLGEQSILRKEIYCTGDPANDDVVFGYQERWSEYRYHPSMITGLFRSTAASNIDEWHAAQQFASAPTLNATFLVETPPMARVLAAGALAAGQQFLFDSVFSVRATRAMPTYSVPGFIDRF